MWSNCAKKDTVSPVTNKATSLEIAQINLQIASQPIRRRKAPKPNKPRLMNMKLLMKKIMEAQKTTPGSVKVKLSQKKRKLPSTTGL